MPSKLVESGSLERVGPGRYQLAPPARATEHRDLVVATMAVPRSVVCLTSALQFHGIATQLPAQVWLAVPRLSVLHLRRGLSFALVEIVRSAGGAGRIRVSFLLCSVSMTPIVVYDWMKP